MVRDEFDTVLKRMFGIRGETRRINVAEKLGRQPYHQVHLGAEFDAAIEAMRHCLTIRNHFAHCNWWNDNSGKLAFANLEEMGIEEQIFTGLDALTTFHVDEPLLLSQEAYFLYTSQLFVWMNYEGRVRNTKLASNPVQRPQQVTRPALHLALDTY